MILMTKFQESRDSSEFVLHQYLTQNASEGIWAKIEPPKAMGGLKRRLIKLGQLYLFKEPDLRLSQLRIGPPTLRKAEFQVLKPVKSSHTGLTKRLGAKLAKPLPKPDRHQ